MTAAKKLTQKQVERITEVWIDRLNLPQWAIELDWSHTVEDDNDAEIHTPKDYDTAKFAINAEWPNWSITKLNEVIAHELMHLHFHNIQVAALSCGDFMSREARMLYQNRISHELEKAVDVLAVAMVNEMGPA